MSDVPMSEADYRAESDARALMRAQEVKSNPVRMRRAQSMLRKIQQEMQSQAQAAAQAAGTPAENPGGNTMRKTSRPKTDFWGKPVG